MTIFPRILKLMGRRDQRRSFGGGIIPEPDIVALKKAGVGALFTPGATLDIAAHLKEWLNNTTGTRV